MSNCLDIKSQKPLVEANSKHIINFNGIKVYYFVRFFLLNNYSKFIHRLVLLDWLKKNGLIQLLV
jgi:hypothetical protein